MLYTIICTDQKNGLELRKQNRLAHLDYLKTLGDRLFSAGPTLTENGNQPTGSIIIAKFDSFKEALHFANEDPYSKAGLFEETIIKRFRQIFPTELG